MVTLEITESIFLIEFDKVTVLDETTVKNLPKILCWAIVETDVDKYVRVFPNNFTIVDVELDKYVKVFGMDFTIVANDVDSAVMVLVMAFLIVEVDVTTMLKEIKWNADSVRTTSTCSTTVVIILFIARCIDATLVLNTDKSFIGNLTRLAIDELM